ncbi:MAG: ABC transporter permease [Bacillota bacterium]|nr:ABC transporter permease [Bacillota bacterium]
MEVKKNKIFTNILAIFIIFLLWHIASKLLGYGFLPDPIWVLKNTSEIFLQELGLHIAYSLFRILAGISISLVLGLTIGLFMGRCNGIDRILSPFVYLIYPIPKIAFLPLVMLLCGLGEMAKITMIVLIVVFQIIVAARDAAKSLPIEKFWGVRSLGASRGTILRRVILPGSLPGILSGLRISLGTALSVLFFTETFGTTYGLGYYIMDSWNRVNYVDMFSGIVTLAVVGFLLFFLTDLAAKKSYH